MLSSGYYPSKLRFLIGFRSERLPLQSILESLILFSSIQSFGCWLQRFGLAKLSANSSLPSVELFNCSARQLTISSAINYAILKFRDLDYFVWSGAPNRTMRTFAEHDPARAPPAVLLLSFRFSLSHFLLHSGLLGKAADLPTRTLRNLDICVMTAH